MADLRTARFSAARLANLAFGRLLRLLVKAQVLPEPVPLDPERPVCYVLESSALSNVLILQQVATDLRLPRPLDRLQIADADASRSLIALQALKGMIFRRPDMRVHLRQLRALYNAVDGSTQPPPNEDEERASELQVIPIDVQLVPVSILLGRSPDKQQSFFGILFSENWTIAGRLRRLVSLLLHGRNTLVQFSQPISLREAIDEGLERPRTVRKISRLLRVHFRRVRSAAIGPDLSHRRTLVDDILRTRNVRDAIRSQANKNQTKLPKERRKALKYAREIAADYSYPVVRVASRGLTWFWNRIYDGIKVRHMDDFNRVAHSGAELIYVPCHRSHIDYLLLSYLLYKNGLVVPHIAAGVNLNLPVVGSILRRGGAFFLRRSFRGNPLYSAVFHEYVNALFANGVSMEYFIEGTRSRSGRLLRPRTGMVAMTVRSFLRHQERPVVFVPIYIGYERLVEGGAYIGELSGGRKKKETLGGLMRSWRILREEYGKVHVSFGDPIDLAEHLDASHVDWRDMELGPDEKPDWLNPTVGALAQKIMIEINRSAHLNPINLLASALLASPKNAMAEEDLVGQIDLLRSLASALPYSSKATVTEMDGEAIVDYAEAMGVIQRREHALGDVLVCDEREAVLLSYFRNNMLHTIAAVGFCATVFLNNVVFRRKDLLRIANVIYPFLRSELFLHWNTKDFVDECRKAIKVLKQQGLLVDSGTDGLLQRAPGGSAEALQLKLLCKGTFSSLERYYITVAMLVKNGSGSLSAGELEQLCHLTAQRLSMLYSFESPEFFDKKLFKDFIQQLRRANVLATDDDGKLIFDDRLSNLIQEAKALLGKEIRHTIWQVTPEREDDPDAQEQQAA